MKPVYNNTPEEEAETQRLYETLDSTIQLREIEE